jgi:hypothetical protein
MLLSQQHLPRLHIASPLAHHLLQQLHYMLPCCSWCAPAAMEKQGHECAPSNFWVLDKDGLITQERSNLPDYVSRFARPVGADARDGAGLLEVVKAVKPTVLLGLAGTGPARPCRPTSRQICACAHVCICACISSCALYTDSVWHTCLPMLSTCETTKCVPLCRCWPPVHS